MRGLVIALHDLAPSTLAEVARWRSIVAGLTHGPVSLLVIPRYGGRESWRSGPAPAWLRARIRAGDEAVLHGYSHLSRDGRDGAELAHRPPGSVTSLIHQGVDELSRAGVAVEGFIAPRYAQPAETRAACRSAGLRWWAGRTTLGWSGRAVRLPSLGLGASSVSRRVLSPPVARLAVRTLSRVPVVRLDLHPADLRHPRLERAGHDLLAELLAQGRYPLTHADVISLCLPGSITGRQGSGASGVRAAA